MEAEFEDAKAAMTAQALYRDALANHKTNLANKEMEELTGIHQSDGDGSYLWWLKPVKQIMDEAGSDSIKLATSSGLSYEVLEMNGAADWSNEFLEVDEADTNTFENKITLPSGASYEFSGMEFSSDEAQS